ncbi:AcrR family transcriptional regulator [Caulobacter ginsengisoli]|uniref:AcrR family transcriptional regulator n=1 Tax=Caulobacter ginsengisoli TaxID=400775 RepID=A0ABU0IPS4_9CAUL|nr:helix-turn-helix domain-containing protein [Caulobacter ginsengisoli]MDQ0464004.1 AcrR family transcriptional regulator [Caulobacter ginsengisoli]
MSYRSVRRQGWRSAISSDAAVTDTRADFLRAAKRLFAERGFYGASIAAIADELGLTKQALLHHFASKERLYGEVLAQMAQNLTAMIGKAGAGGADPEQQLEILFQRLYDNTLDHPHDTQLLMRELLDNRPRAEHAHSWHMRDFLDGLIALARKTRGGAALGDTEILARLYLLIGAMTYAAVSEPTLRQMYAEGFDSLQRQLPLEIRRLVLTSFGGTKA